MDIVEILERNGYKTVIGQNAVLGAIKNVAGSDFRPRCSGYRVFPDGRKCDGCPDCEQSNQAVQPTKE